METSSDDPDEENFDEENSIKNMNILLLNMNINFIYQMHWVCPLINKKDFKNTKTFSYYKFFLIDCTRMVREINLKKSN